MRTYSTISKLRAGSVIDLEGLKLVADPGPIGPGDLYVAERNTGPQLLTAKSVNTRDGYILPAENAYAYDIGECVKVKEAV